MSNDVLTFFNKDELAIGVEASGGCFYIDGHPYAIETMVNTLFENDRHLHVKIIGVVDRRRVPKKESSL